MAKRLAEAVPGDFPVFVKPNAGLPRADGSGYDITPAALRHGNEALPDLHLFAAGAAAAPRRSSSKLLNSVFCRLRTRPSGPTKCPRCCVTPVDFVNVDGQFTVVGERINPTGKKRFQQALREEDMNYVLEAGGQSGGSRCSGAGRERGAPGVDEPALMPKVVQGPAERHQPAAAAGFLQCAGTGKRPARVQTASPSSTLPTASGKSWTRSCPCAKKYGAAIVGLAIDERGILPAAEDRVAIARRITEAASCRRHPAGGHLHRLSDPDRQRPAEGCSGHRAGTGSLQKRAGGAHHSGPCPTSASACPAAPI